MTAHSKFDSLSLDLNQLTFHARELWNVSDNSDNTWLHVNGNYVTEHFNVTGLYIYNHLYNYCGWGDVYNINIYTSSSYPHN